MSEFIQIARDASLEEVQAIFVDDRFACGLCGCEVLEVAYGRVVCAFDITDEHLNLSDRVMGGAIFTLADFCLGIVANYNQPASVSTSCHIEFLAASSGKRLIATANCDKDGRTLGFYTVVVTDDQGTDIALMQAVCTRIQD